MWFYYHTCSSTPRSSSSMIKNLKALDKESRSPGFCLGFYLLLNGIRLPVRSLVHDVWVKAK